MLWIHGGKFDRFYYPTKYMTTEIISLINLNTVEICLHGASLVGVGHAQLYNSIELFEVLQSQRDCHDYTRDP